MKLEKATEILSQQTANFHKVCTIYQEATRQQRLFLKVIPAP